jgi:hypothetical protein
VPFSIDQYKHCLTAAHDERHSAVAQDNTSTTTNNERLTTATGQYINDDDWDWASGRHEQIADGPMADAGA